MRRVPAHAVRRIAADVVMLYSNQNPVLFYATDSGALHLFHSQQPANKGEDNATVWHLVSYGGRGLPGNWTPPHEVFAKPGSFTRNRLILSLQKEWILPMYYARGPAVDQVPMLCVHIAPHASSPDAFGPHHER